jgi:hypothetical protein
MTLTQWLKQRLDVFDLRVRASKCKAYRHDIYYCSGWADGYKAAQCDARKALRFSNDR